MKKLIFLICILMTSLVMAQHKDQEITQELPKNTNRILIVDVRTAAEYQDGHLPNAQNIDWFSPRFNEGFKGLKKRQKIYVYCRSGKRSALASARLNSLGFKRVVNLLGGYNSYKAAQ